MIASMSTRQRYLPATGRLPLTALYDRLVALTSREGAFRRAVVDAATAAGPPLEILDVGCGTGTQAIALAQAGATVTGIDGDPQILARARRKAADAGAGITLLEGRAEALPVPDASVDCVTSTLMFHHLDSATKLAALREASRVLRPGGRLVIADWGRPQDPLMAVAFLTIRLVDGFETTRDSASGRLPELVAGAGFADVHVQQRWRTPVGTLELLTGATRGAPAPG
jgi:SAM-dependent methyltransferase